MSAPAPKDPADDALFVHATCVVIGEAGALIRGASGAGKSRLAQALIAEGAARGLFARLVADDRVALSLRHGRVIARPHWRAAGLIEERGAGVMRQAHEPAVVLRLVVDCAVEIERCPAAEALRADIRGVDLPRVALARCVEPTEGARRILARLAPPQSP